jgi:signal transduction histidine kinase
MKLFEIGRSVRKRTPMGLWILSGAAVMAMILAGVIFARLASNAASAEVVERQSSAAREITVGAMAVLLDVNDAESWERSRLLTHRADDLAAFDQAVKAAGQALDRLQALAAGDPEMVQTVGGIRSATERRLDLLRQIIDLDSHGRSGAVAPLANAEGRPAMNEVRRRIAALIERAQARQAAFQAGRDTIRRQVQWAEAVLAVLALAALLGSLFSLVHERAAARRADSAAEAEAELREAHLLAEQAQLRAEEAKAQAEAAKVQAEEANRAKSRFLATASHDMRQPLHAMALYISVLDRRLQSEAEREVLGNMDSAVKSMIRMFTALLDLARLEAGVLKPEPAVVSLGGLLRDVADQSVDPRKDDASRLTVVDTDMSVHTDPDILEIILRNLTSNAMKYSQGGRVLIGARRCGGEVLIEVHDTGQGIPPEQLDRLFSEFTRGEEVRSIEGVGLGLSIVERMAHLLGHKLSVRSTLGNGTVFGVTVPRATRSIARRGAAAPASSLEGVRILIADDQALALDAMRLAFADAGAIVTTASTARQVRTLGQEPFDLYVFDLNLGRENGQDLLRELNQERSWPTPGLIVTGATTEDVLGRLRDMGQPWVNKPISAAKLIRAAQILLGQPISAAS